MKQLLTQKEIDKIQNLCLSNPIKSCAIVQTFIDNLQLVSCADFAELKGKSKRTILYQAKKKTGVEIYGRKYLTFN
jgi:hypothetical protein